MSAANMNHHSTHVHFKTPPKSIAHVIIGIIAILAIVGLLILFSSTLTARVVHPCLSVQCPADTLCTAVQGRFGLEARCVPIVERMPRIIARFVYTPQSSIYDAADTDIYPHAEVRLPSEELPANKMIFCDNDKHCPGSSVCRLKYFVMPGFNEQQPTYARICIPEELA
ncbi:MAG: hypothetical protein HY363_04125 [Candidatus Aenigmarchaeota archaeon]|nr:hypothetical protein [Candidatus Aenigmarchaeota archaeon]